MDDYKLVISEAPCVAASNPCQPTVGVSKINSQTAAPAEIVQVDADGQARLRLPVPAPTARADYLIPGPCVGLPPVQSLRRMAAGESHKCSDTTKARACRISGRRMLKAGERMPPDPLGLDAARSNLADARFVGLEHLAS